MTVGQRIAQKRKEQNLSQEALGEALGVSRQSVYKWESGSALPEIDKFVTMSRIFHVTIGWLLGVEEDENPPDPGKADPGELNETQLKMVEEIVDRYLAARQPPKKRRWPWAIAAVAVICLLAVLYSLRSDLQNMQYQYTNLQGAVNNVRWSVDSQIGGITNRVEEVLKNQNNLTASYGTALLSADLAANTVTFTAYATPKTYTEGMTAVFLIDDGGTITEFPGKSGENQTFAAELTCKLTDEITISVVFITGDVRETQLLDTHYALYIQSLPDVNYIMGPTSGMMWKERNADGALDWSGEYTDFRREDHSSVYYYTGGDQIERAEMKSLRVGLFRNRKLLGWLEPCEIPKNYHNFDDGDYDFYRFPSVSVTPEPDDIFTITAVVVDEYDREFVYSGIPYSLERDINVLETAQVDHYYGLDNPTNWEY